METAGLTVIRDVGAASPGAAHPRPATLSGNLSTFDIVFTVLAYNAPLTVVTGFLALIISVGNGLGSPVTFLMAGGLMLLFAVGFTTMSKDVPNAGAFYAYIAVGLGRPIGFSSALMAMLAYAFLMLGIYLYGGIVYTSLLEQVLGANNTPWWLFALLLLALVSFFGYRRISLSARVLTLALVCEVLLVLAWEVAIAFRRGPVGLSPSWLTISAFTSGSVGIGMLLGVTSFAGFEATAVFREEARAPHITVPRATYAAVIVLALLFSSASYFYICGYGPAAALTRSTASPSTAVLECIGQFLGRFGQDSVTLLLCSSVFACLLALHNIIARYLYCLGIDGTVPRAWAVVHPRHGSPHRASVIVSVVMFVSILVLALVHVPPYAGYAALSGTGGYVLLLLLVLTSMSVFVHFRKSRTRDSWLKTVICPLVSFVLLVAVAVLATANMSLLTGDLAVAVGLLALIGATLLGGCIYAMALKRTKPDVYMAIGRQNI